jgi:RNA-binding protein 25
LTDPSAQASPTTKAAALPSAAEARAAAQAAVPSHLKDLNEGDLPEAQREVVLDQIAVFREQAARKEKERKMLEADRERFRQNESRQQQHSQQQPQQRQWGQRAGSQQSPIAAPSAGFGNGPQSYQAPVGFVKSQGAEGKGEGERTDEEEEELRQMKKLRERETMLREVRLQRLSSAG